MPPFRVPKERIDRLAGVLAESLAHSPALTLKNPSEAKALFRNMLTENLRIEHEIEEEVMATLQKHGQAIYQQKADFQKLLTEGKRVIAKKRNFVL
jgi:hypothetical protein